MSKKKRKAEETKKIPPWVNPLLLGLLVIGAFLSRVVPSWSQVFVDGQVWFRAVDPWYHMRLVDNMMANFPTPLQWDMLSLFPGGMHVGYFPLLSWIIASLGQVFNYEVVGALLPPILGALTLISIYFICRILWTSWVGLIACLLATILPTEFFHRSLLGFTDHHILEIFFSVNTILFLILLSRNGKLRWAVLAGISLGLYVSSWAGGLLLVALIWAWFLITFLYKLREKEPIGLLCKNVSIVFGLGLLLFALNLPFVRGLAPYVVLLGLVAVSPSLFYLASKATSWKIILIATAGCLVLSGILAQALLPQIWINIRSTLISTLTTIQEALPSGPRVIMSHYGISFLLGTAGLVLCIKNKQNLLLVLWGLLMLALMISQRRWSYYFAITNSILAGYFIYLVSTWVHREAKHAVVIAMCVLLFSTTLSSAISISRLPILLTNDWYQACVWLRENTPEVEGYYDSEAEEIDYGVLSWWDFGNWITRVGRRAPCSNPMAQRLNIQWNVFLAESEEEANTYLDNIEYIIVDEDMVTIKFYAIVRLSSRDVDPDSHVFLFSLWEETTTTWEKVHQAGTVRIYGRK